MACLSLRNVMMMMGEKLLFIDIATGWFRWRGRVDDVCICGSGVVQSTVAIIRRFIQLCIFLGGSEKTAHAANTWWRDTLLSQSADGREILVCI